MEIGYSLCKAVNANALNRIGSQCGTLHTKLLTIHSLSDFF